MVLEFFTLWREVVWICQEPGADGIPGKHSLARMGCATPTGVGNLYIF